jgi:hypothetical protein
MEKSPRVKGMGWMLMDTWDRTQIIAVNIPVSTKSLVLILCVFFASVFVFIICLSVSGPIMADIDPDTYPP